MGRLWTKIHIKTWPKQSWMRKSEACKPERGSSASQAHGCCFNAGLLQQFVTMGAEQAMQHLSAIHGQLSNKIEVQRQSPRCMFLKEKVEEEEGEEREKEQRKRAATWENGPPGPGCRNEGFPTSSVFVRLHLQGNTGEGDGTSFVYLDKEMEEERGRQVRKEKWERMQSCARAALCLLRGDSLP